MCGPNPFHKRGKKSGNFFYSSLVALHCTVQYSVTYMLISQLQKEITRCAINNCKTEQLFCHSSEGNCSFTTYKISCRLKREVPSLASQTHFVRVWPTRLRGTRPLSLLCNGMLASFPGSHAREREH